MSEDIVSSTDNAVTESPVALTPGQRLRAAREQKGLSLPDASRSLYLAQRMVQAIENDAYKELPEPAFVKGYIRRYAKLLDLSGDELVQAFEHSYGNDSGTLALEAKPANPLQELGSFSSPLPIKKWVMLAAGVALLLLLIGIVVSFANRSAEPVATATESVVVPEVIEQAATESTQADAPVVTTQPTPAVPAVVVPAAPVKAIPTPATPAAAAASVPAVLNQPPVSQNNALPSPPVMMSLPEPLPPELPANAPANERP